MEVRTFEGLTMQDAVKSVRGVFGKDAVILKTQEKQNRDSGGRSFIITAARAGSDVDSGISKESSDQAIYEIVSELRVLKSEIKNLIQNQVTRNDLLVIDGRMDDLRRYLLTKREKEEGSIDSRYSEIIYTLEAMGVEQGMIDSLNRYLSNLPLPDDSTQPHYYRDFAIRWILKRVQISPPLYDVQGEGNYGVHVFCGSAGSGKTSTIAKIASWLSKDHALSPVVISLGKTQLAGNENLRIFCKVAGVEFHCFDDVSDLSSKIESMSDRVVLVDTSGLCFSNGHLHASLEIIKNIPNILPYFHVVMSMNDRSEQMERVIQKFAPIGICSLVFSRIDESWLYGDILNISHKWGVPLSFFSTGQRIPEDLEKATRERVVERIFGLGV